MEGLRLVSLLLVVLFGSCVQMRPVPIFGGMLVLLSTSSSSSLLLLFLLDFFFFFFLGAGEKLTGGGLCRINLVKSSPGRTASGGCSKAAVDPSGGGGRAVGAGGRATADMAFDRMMGCEEVKKYGMAWLRDFTFFYHYLAR